MPLTFSPTYASSEGIADPWSLVISYPVSHSLIFTVSYKASSMNLVTNSSNYVTLKHREFPHSKSLAFNLELQEHLCIKLRWADSD